MAPQKRRRSQGVDASLGGGSGSGSREEGPPSSPVMASSLPPSSPPMLPQDDDEDDETGFMLNAAATRDAGRIGGRRGHASYEDYDDDDAEALAMEDDIEATENMVRLGLALDDEGEDDAELDLDEIGEDLGSDIEDDERGMAGMLGGRGRRGRRGRGRGRGRGDQDDDGEDLFAEGMEDDYNFDERLDTYDIGQLDQVEYNAMDPAQRARAEAMMRRRDALEAARRGDERRSRIPAAFLDEFDDLTPGAAPTVHRRRRLDAQRPDWEYVFADGEGRGMAGADGADPAAALDGADLHNFRGRSLDEWLTLPGTRRGVQNEFRHFLSSQVTEDGASIYAERIRRLGQDNRESLVVDYSHLAAAKPILAFFLANAPAKTLELFDEVAFEMVLSIFHNYDRIKADIHVRIAGLPTTCSLRDLRQVQLNTLVRVVGIVSRRSSVFPQLKYVKYNCTKCGAVLGPFHQDSSAQNEVRIGSCPNCQSKGPFIINSEQTIYRNFQRVTVQESPGTVPAGRLPRHRDVILLWDLIDSAKPGDEVDITGIYRNNFDASLNTKNGFPVFATVIEANHVVCKDDAYAAVNMTDDDQRAVIELSRDRRIGKRIIKSIAPSIFGHENIKTALALALFGGCPKNVGDKHRLRGDINVLLLGDPGTAKSQFLKYVEQTAHRAVFTTGQGASAVGLTASVRKDPVTREWTLEGGALVLADRGVCLIDEFDKMNDQDRTSIHEAMEQQTISISKAGIVTTLQARCAVIAAANPEQGRYNPMMSFAQNVQLTEPILSRFDVLCVVRDTVDPINDENLASFVVNSHMRNHPDAAEDDQLQQLQQRQQDPDIIPQELLRKYITYARETVRPRLHQVDQAKLSSLYAELRRESLATGGIPITVRHMESMIRMAEAHARMHLREHVSGVDIDVAIRVMLDSFIGAQKLSVMKSLRRSFTKYMVFHRDNDEILMYTLSRLLTEKVNFQQTLNRTIRNASGRDNGGDMMAGSGLPDVVSISCVEFEAHARETSVEHTHILPFYQSHRFREGGFEYDQQNNVILKRFSQTA
ncbi:MCM-domain-containing protein [Ramicandelaber brevisporus]|nr:MCM-domain-containing protein [Ramicandelaber brevisporus]